jgi:hypothetical protein
MKKESKKTKEAKELKQYKALVVAMAKYREGVLKYISDAPTNLYERVFTERRAKGIRSKLWYSRISDKHFKTLQRLVAIVPYIYVNGIKYHVTVTRSEYVMCYRKTNDVSFRFTQCK